MKLRICICLFAILSLISIISVFRYVSLRKDYASLSRQYEEKIAQQEQAIASAGQTEPEKNAENQNEQTDSSRSQQVSSGENFYYVTLNNDEIIAYTGDHREVCMRTRIDEEELAKALIQELKQGIYLENLPALYEYLENCSS